jgi:hypothetical protein
MIILIFFTNKYLITPYANEAPSYVEVPLPNSSKINMDYLVA